MPNTYFTFKRFTVHHDLCAMKVGTDGVLLGAWADVSSAESILDVGTGSGLIALMAAQRSNAYITGIDIDESAVAQAQINFGSSPWNGRLEAVHTDLRSYSPDCRFDVIVSNPPFFVDSLKCTDRQRNTARHNDTMPLSLLLEKASLFLQPHGRLSLILPFEQHEFLTKTAVSFGLYPTRHTFVITRPGLAPKRSLMEFRKQPEAYIPQELIVELERHVYSEKYIALTKDFYLKM